MTSADALTDPALLLLERLLRLGLLGVRDLARGAHLRILADLTAAVAPANAREEEVSDFETLALILEEAAQQVTESGRRLSAAAGYKARLLIVHGGFFQNDGGFFRI